MKKLIAIITIILTAVTGFSQAPDSLQYSMTVQAGTYTISITQGDMTPVFQSGNILATSDTTLHLKLGISDTISWSQGPYHLRVFDNTLLEIGNTQLVSVPYAKYATRAQHADTASVSTNSGVILSNLTYIEAQNLGYLTDISGLTPGTATVSVNTTVISVGNYSGANTTTSIIGAFGNESPLVIQNFVPGDYVYILTLNGWIKVTF